MSIAGNVWVCILLQFCFCILELSSNFYYSPFSILHNELLGMNKINLSEPLGPEVRCCLVLSRFFLIRRFCVSEQNAHLLFLKLYCK